jgi:hypothetical protein
MQPMAVGQKATDIARMIGLRVQPHTKLLIAPIRGVGREHPLSVEKLFPVLAVYRAKSVDEALKVSHFGLCLMAATEPALRRLISLPPVSKALEDGRLILWDRKSFTSENCIACGAVSGHPRLVHIGVAAQPTFFDGQLRQAYKEYASKCFAGRDELLGIYRRLQPLLAKAKRTPKALADHLALDIGKTAFALKVFAELELIEMDKGDRILTLNAGGPRRELRASACFRSFEELIDG